MDYLKDFKVVWVNPNEFTVFFKTEDGGSGLIDGTFSGEDSLELIPGFDTDSKQANEFFELLKKLDTVYGDFFEKYAHSVKYNKHDVYSLVINYKDSKGELKQDTFGFEFYNENEADWKIQIEYDDKPEKWLDDDENEFISIEYKLLRENVYEYGYKRRQYKIISVEEELLIQSESLESVKEKFLDYINNCKQEFVRNKDRTNDEVIEELKIIKEDIEDFNKFDEHLIDYGFKPLIKEV